MLLLGPMKSNVLTKVYLYLGIHFCCFYRDIQTDPATIMAGWDTSGDPCPATKYEWAIERLDGKVISSFLDMGCE